MHKNDTRYSPAIRGCLIILERFRALRDRLQLEEYTRKYGRHSSIGHHLRHCLEYMLCLKQGISTGAIDYDQRIRNERLETEREIFDKTIKEITAWLTSLDSEVLNRALNIQEMSVAGVRPRPSQSSLERELVFQASHSIHHLAIVVLIGEIIGVGVPYDFGVAPSTLFYSASRNHPSA